MGAPVGVEDSQGQLINPSTKELQQEIKSLLQSVVSGSGEKLLFGSEEFEVTATNANGDPTTVVYRATPAGATIATLTITYDANNNVLKTTLVLA